MRKAIFAVFVLLIASCTFAQSVVHPYVAGGFILNGAGQVPLGLSADGGVQIDAKHLFTYSEAGYETGGKSNDNDNTSSKGHTRLLSNQTLARFGNWYAGVGADYDKLYTPDYAKSSIHPKATVGREFHSGYISKLLVSYVNKGTDWQNGVTGVEAQAWWNGKHVFFRMTVGAYRYHDTVIPVSEGGSSTSVARELATHHGNAVFQNLLGFRF